MKKRERKKDSRHVIKIAAEQCKSCGKCVAACPKNILRIGTSINSYGFKYAICVADTCVGCGNCFYSCPEPGAITIYLLDADAGTVGKTPLKDSGTERKCLKKKK